MPPPHDAADVREGGAPTGPGHGREGLARSREEAWGEDGGTLEQKEEDGYEEEEEWFSFKGEAEAAGESEALIAHGGKLAALSLPCHLATARRAEPPTPRQGYGVRGGVLRVSMPSCISHSVLLCRERDKAAAAAAACPA
mmetsp:Transcript_17072/g.55688  ORF Transcript_17072/g.55688 Transcript_17072/m.55688 type:complete len:140 (-) Transcript_17072:1620-2039(-)